MATIRVLTDDPNIPDGMACLSMDDHGWVGTSNGSPFTGKPALYPKAQAEAIANCFNYMANVDSKPIIEAPFISEEAKNWIVGFV